jgi:GGDEF domain-containing protein
MAARDHHRRIDEPSGRSVACLSESAVHERLAEEINRAGRHRRPLSCLLVRIESLLEAPGELAGRLPEQTLAYVAEALGRIVRSFDRIGRVSDSELVIALPGAEGPQAEIVGRRMLERLHTIKVEADGERRPLRVSVGLSVWEDPAGAGELVARARAPLRPVNGDAEAATQSPSAPVLDPWVAIRRP